jgi:hypothetical protein
VAQSDPLGDLLSRAFEVGVDVEPIPVPEALRQRIIDRAGAYSNELLAAKLLDAAGAAGWSVEDLAAEVGSKADDARRLLSGKGDPRCLGPKLWGKLLARISLDPAAIRSLLKQTVASYVVFPKLAEGQIFGRTTGLSCEGRASALGSDEVVRDPERAGRVAEAFVAEVAEAWESQVR